MRVIMMQLYLFVDESTNTQIPNIMKILDYYQEDYPHQMHVIDIEKTKYVKNAFINKLPILDIGSFRIIKPNK